MNTSQHVRIQNFLRNLGRTGEFFVKTYEDGIAQDIDLSATETAKLAPLSCEVNEVEETYTTDTRYGRDIKLKRDQWAFQMILKFSKEVTLEAFIDDLLANPPVLPRDGDFAPAFCFLRRKTIQHPPREGSPTGTQAILLFAINTGRD